VVRQQGQVLQASVNNRMKSPPVRDNQRIDKLDQQNKKLQGTIQRLSGSIKR